MQLCMILFCQYARLSVFSITQAKRFISSLISLHIAFFQRTASALAGLLVQFAYENHDSIYNNWRSKIAAHQ